MADRTQPRSVVAVLAAHWESKTEEGWIARQVAGALACTADVHIITPEGSAPGTVTDSVFSIHRTATPIEASAELRRAVLVGALSESSTERDIPTQAGLSALIDRDLIAPWRDASDVMNLLRPNQALIVGHQNVGALKAVNRHSSKTPVALLALGSDLQGLAFSHFDQLFERADSVLAITETERMSIVKHHGRQEVVHKIGAPMAANPSVLSEPNTWVGATNYVLVVTGVDMDEDHEETGLSRLLRMRFPDNPIGIVHNDGFCTWYRGQLSKGWPIERSSDMARLLAWARVTVDLRPGRLFARRCIDSLLYGTPIVVPHDSRAREHAERGRGGLWFTDPAELILCVEALLEPSTRDTLSAQGRCYSEEEYGSTDRFIERVVNACGLPSAAIPAHVTS